MTSASDLSWSRTAPAVAARRLIVRGILGPVMDLYARRSVQGQEVFAAIEGPAVLVATHASHMDAPTILRGLPPHVARRTAVAAAADYFCFGPPVRPAPGEHRTAVMERVRRFFAACGARTTVDKRIAAERRRAVSV